MFQYDYKLILKMNPNPNSFITVSYPLQTGLKALFIVFAIARSPYILLIGFLASLLGMLRMLKMPKFNKEYLQKMLMNNHGQNILYIGMGAMGYSNFLFLSPLILYFAYGLLEFYNQKFPKKDGEPESKLRQLYEVCKNNRFYIMEGKSRLQILYFIYLLITIPIDFSRILKCFLMAQFNLLKYRASAQTRHSAATIHSFINEKIRAIGFLHSAYNKLVDYMYKIATAQPQQRN